MKKLKCKHCGNEYQFYTKESYKGNCNYWFDSEGNELEDNDIYHCAQHKNTSKFIFCYDCNKKVGKIEEFEAWQD